MIVPLPDALYGLRLQQGIPHADETAVQMPALGTKKAQRTYVWAYASSPFVGRKVVVYDLSPISAG